MKTYTRRITAMTLVAGFWMLQGGLISVAQADDASIAIDNLVAGYGRQMTGTNNNQLFAPSASVNFATAYGQVQINLTNNASTMLIPLMPDANGNLSQNATGQDLGQTAIQTLLTASPTTIGNYQQALNNALATAPSVNGLFSGFGGNASQVPFDTNATLPNYDIKSLINPLGYANQATVQTALNYIQFMAQPSFNANIEKLRGYNSPNFLPYIMTLRSYVAMQSIGLANFYKSFSDRVRITGLGGQAGISNSSNAPASVLEVEDYAAKKRVADSNWYKAMETATPATIERETLYVLAEMRLEMYKNRLALERLILTNSAILMQLNTPGATSPLMQLQGKVQPSQ
jgi:hypothetical protein